MSWTGNNKVFKTYVKGSSSGDGKSPAEKVKGLDSIRTFENASQFDCFGGILNEGFVDVSFDTKEMYNAFLDMAEANQWRCLCLPSTKGGHTYWRAAADLKGGRDKKLAVGLVADVHNKSTYIPLRVHGTDRFPPDYDVFDGEDYQELPDELLPVDTNIDLWGLDAGDGRNDTLSRMTKYLIHNTHLTKEQIRRVMTNANSFVFKEPLSDYELNTVLRDETFSDLKEVSKLNILNGVELFNMDIKPVEFVINGLIPVGLTLLASPPKYGKSWLCLDMAVSVASGTDFLGFTTNEHDTLYLALEDREDRLKQRLQMLLNNQPFPRRFNVTIKSETLNNGLIEQLEAAVKENPGIKLIIIDTFAKVRGESKRNESAYSTDSREAGIIKEFADRLGIAVVLVTHTRKGIDPTDPFVNITGTFGISGIADDMIVLTKENRNSEYTKMSVTGRDVSYEEYPLMFNKEHGRWMRQADCWDDFMNKTTASIARMEYDTGNIKKTIFRLLEENDGVWKGRCKGILDKGIEFGTPINMTSQTLGKKLKEIVGFFFEDDVVCTEIKHGTAASEYKFEKVKAEEK